MKTTMGRALQVISAIGILGIFVRLLLTLMLGLPVDLRNLMVTAIALALSIGCYLAGLAWRTSPPR